MQQKIFSFTSTELFFSSSYLSVLCDKSLPLWHTLCISQSCNNATSHLILVTIHRWHQRRHQGSVFFSCDGWIRIRLVSEPGCCRSSIQLEVPKNDIPAFRYLTNEVLYIVEKFQKQKFCSQNQIFEILLVYNTAILLCTKFDRAILDISYPTYDQNTFRSN